jgi:hypothetical protein
MKDPAYRRGYRKAGRQARLLTAWNRTRRVVYRAVETILPWVGWFFLLSGLAGAVATIVGAGPRPAGRWGFVAAVAAWLVLAVEGFGLLVDDAQDEGE